jgi:hypothetical protein
MRVSVGVLSTTAIVVILAGCDAATAAAPCGTPTSAAFVSTELTGGTVISIISRDDGSRELELATGADPADTFSINVASSTPVFETTGGASPVPSNVCRVHVGATVDFPFGDGFGDFSTPPEVAPTVSELVILHS